MSESQRDLGIKAFRAGNRILAFQYLTKAIKENSQDELAWLWLAACVDSDDKKRFCLQKVLEINPSNPSAKRELQQMASMDKQEFIEPTRQTQISVRPASHQKNTSFSSLIAQKKQKTELSKEQKQLKRGYRKYTISLVSLASTLMFVTLGIAFALQPDIYTSHSIDTSIPQWINQQPTPDEISRLGTLIENFENPSKQTYQEINSVEALQSLNPTPVTLKGRLLGGFLVNFMENNGAPIYGLEIKTGNNTLFVLHRGYIGNLRPGNTIRIEGIYLPQVRGISAHKIISENLLVGFSTLQNQRLTRWVVLDIIWAIFSITVYLWASTTIEWRKVFGKFTPAVSIILLVFILSACTIDFTTTLDSNGTGHVTVTARETGENMDFMRKVPGMTGYLDALNRQLQSEGMLVTQWVTGSDESIFLQKAFSSWAEIGPVKGSNMDGSWVTIQEYDENEWKVIRYIALVDTTILFKDTPGVDDQVNSEVNNQMSQIDMSYSLVLPGQITYHNASRVTGNKVIWEIDMNKRNPILVETRIPRSANTFTGAEKYIEYGFMLLFFIFTWLLFSAFLKLTRKHTDKPDEQKN